MKIECIKEKISSAIGNADRVTGKNMSLPVLSCILLEAKDNSLTIRSTNLDMGVEITIPAKVKEEGSVAVPGQILNLFISSLSTDSINVIMESDNSNLKLTTNKTSTIIKCQPTDDFPTLPRITSDKSFNIPSSDFIKGLKSVWYSSSVSGVKPELASVYVYYNSGDMVFAATDSFRLAEKRVKMKKDGDFGSVLIPYKNIPEIIKILDGINEEVNISLDKNQISFKYSNLYMISRVVDGVFPDYKQIIPKGNTTEIIVLKQDLINSLKVSNIFGDKFNQINFKLNPKAGICEVKTKNNDIGESINKIDSTLTGEDLEINFNLKYISDCFQSMDSDSISLSFNGLNKPLVLRPISDNSFTYLVMPMNR